jgi:hypothetical protein
MDNEIMTVTLSGGHGSRLTEETAIQMNPIAETGGSLDHSVLIQHSQKTLHDRKENCIKSHNYSISIPCRGNVWPCMQEMVSTVKK